MLQQFHFRVFIKETSNLKRYMQPHNHCSFIYNGQDMKATQVSTNEWMDREDVVYMWCICVYVYIHAIYVEYYLAMKKNEIYAIAWTDLEGIMLSEISQAEKDKYHIISFTCVILKQTTQVHRYWEPIGDCQKRRWGVGETGDKDQKYKHPALKWKRHGNVMYSMVTVINKIIAYLKLAKRINLKSPYHRKKKFIRIYSDRS